MMKKALLLFAIALWCSFTASAQQAGTLDVSFGQQGIVETGFGAGASVMGVGALNDSKILVAARLTELGTNSLLLMRFLPDGTPDNSFGVAGRIRTQMPPEIGFFIRDLVVNPADGSIIVCSAFDSAGRHTISRFLPDGNLDAGFASGGILTEPTNSQANYFAVKLLPDGKILTGGRRWNQGRYDLLIGRLNPNGTKDTSFGTGGQTVYSSTSGSIEGFTLALSPTGHYFLAGTYKLPTESQPRMALASFLTNGTIDAGFGAGGIFIGSQGTPRSVRMQPDGKILMGGGNTSFSNAGFFAINRIMPDGTHDVTFGTSGGVVISQTNALSVISGLEILPDGKFIMSGIVGVRIAMMRFHADGSPDVGFGMGGFVAIELGAAMFLKAILALTDGHLLLAGNILSDDIVLARCHLDGSLDDAFAQNGIVISDFGSNLPTPGRIHYTTDGRILASVAMSNQIVITKYLPNGAMDNSFGMQGRAFIRVPPYLIPLYPTISTDSQGGIIVISTMTAQLGGATDFYIARFHANGTPDSQFGNGSFVIVNFGSGASFLNALEVLEDDKMLLAGTFFPDTGGKRPGIVRLLPDGSPDSTFGDSGLALGPPFPASDCSAMLVQPDGKIVLAGTRSNTPDTPVYVFRFLANGSIDDAFGSDGVAEVYPPDGWPEPHCLLSQSDGKIVLGGNTNGVALLTRLHSDGNLDANFGNSGFFQPPSLTGAVQQVYQDDTGTLLMSGTRYTSAGFRIYLARATADGEADTSFGNGGFVDAPVSFTLNASLLQPDGKLIISGGATGALYLARFHTHLSVSTTERHPEAIPLLVWPNPADEMLYVEYTLPRAGRVHIRLFDVYGRPLQTLLQPDQRAEGPQHEQFRLPDALPAGVYWLSLEADQKSSVVKVVRR